MDVYYKFKPRGSTAGWGEPAAPVLPKGLGTCQDPCVLKEDGKYCMWFSWTEPRLIAYTESPDGVSWEYPTVVLPAVTDSPWEGHAVCRPCVVKQGGKYHMWYTGHMFPTEFSSAGMKLGYAVSDDGITWQRREQPVMIPEEPWEGRAITYAWVVWDEEKKCFKMWYSAGEVRDADAIGYAESPDGIEWKRFGQNPILNKRDGRYFEVSKVLDPVVIRQGEYYYMFYLGMDGDGITGVGVARSKDGITGWVRHPSNPVYAGTDGSWDWIGVRGISLTEEADGWKLWYTGVDRTMRAIGSISRPGIDLSFDEDAPDERGFGECHGEPNWRVNSHIARF